VEIRTGLALSIHVDSMLEQMPGSVILQSMLHTCMQYGLYLLRKPAKTDFLSLIYVTFLAAGAGFSRTICATILLIGCLQPIKPTHSHVVFTLWAYIPPFLLTVNQSPKDIAGSYITIV